MTYAQLKLRTLNYNPIYKREYDTTNLYIPMEHVVYELREHGIEDYRWPDEPIWDFGGVEGETWRLEDSA